MEHILRSSEHNGSDLQLLSPITVVLISIKPQIGDGLTMGWLASLPEHYDRPLGVERRETSMVVDLHQVGLLAEDRPRDGVCLRSRCERATYIVSHHGFKSNTAVHSIWHPVIKSTTKVGTLRVCYLSY